MSNPISNEQQEEENRKVQKLWKRQKFVAVFPSLEGAVSTPESIKGLRPADPDFEK